MSPAKNGTKIALQTHNDHGGRERARNHSAAEIARFSLRRRQKGIASRWRFLGVSLKQNRRKLAATTAASRRSRSRGRSDHGTLSPCQKGGVLMKTGKMANLNSTQEKQELCSSNPRNDENDENGGVTRAKAWFTKNVVFLP